MASDGGAATRPACKGAKVKLRRIAAALMLAAVAQFAVAAVMSAAHYTGGNDWEPNSRSYSFWLNTMSDLGKVDSVSGQVNPWAPAYNVSLIVLAAAVGLLWWFLPRILGPRPLAMVVRVLGMISLAGSIGIGLTPGDRYFVAHTVANGLAAVPAVTALALTTWLIVTGAAAHGGARRFSPAYAALTLLLLTALGIHFCQYVAHFWLGMDWPPAAPAMQKIAMISALVWISWSAVLVATKVETSAA